MKKLIFAVISVVFMSAFASYAQANHAPEHKINVNQFVGLCDKDPIIDGNIYIPCSLPEHCGPGLTCSTNQFNQCSTEICLIALGRSGCVNDSRECEGGTICQDAKCVIDTGEQNFGGLLGSSTSDIRQPIRRFINIALGFLGIVVVVFIVYGGILWLTAAGDDDKVSKGRHTLLWAALGAIIISIAWTISSYILEVGNTIG